MAAAPRLCRGRCGLGPQVVGVGAADLGAHQIARHPVGCAPDKYAAVDLGRVPLGPADGALGVDRIDDDVDRASDLRAGALAADVLLHGHQPIPALLLDLLGYGAGEGVGSGACDRLVFETADAVET